MIRLLIIVAVIGFLGGRAWATSTQVIYTGATTNPSASAVSIGLPQGQGSLGYVATTSSANYSIHLPSSGTAGQFCVNLTTAPGSGKSWTIALDKNGSASAASVTISNTAMAACDTSDTVSYNEDDIIDVRITPTSTPATTLMFMTWQWTPTVDNEFLVFGAGSMNVATPQFNAAGGGQALNTEAVATGIISPAGTFSHLRVSCGASPGTGKSYAYVQRNELHDGSITCTIADTNQTCFDVVNTSATHAGDRLSLKETPTGTPGAATCAWAMKFVPTTTGEFPIMMATANNLTNNQTRYFFPQSAQQQGNGAVDENMTKSTTTAPGASYVMKNGYARVASSIAGGTSYTTTLRQNGASPGGGLSIAINGAGTTGTDLVNSNTIAANDVLDWQEVPVGTPTATNLFLGITGLVTQASATSTPQRTLTGVGL